MGIRLIARYIDVLHIRRARAEINVSPPTSDINLITKQFDLLMPQRREYRILYSATILKANVFRRWTRRRLPVGRQGISQDAVSEKLGHVRGNHVSPARRSQPRPPPTPRAQRRCTGHLVQHISTHTPQRPAPRCGAASSPRGRSGSGPARRWRRRGKGLDCYNKINKKI